MRMRGKKPIFNYSDTFSLDMTLSPIICEGIKKFKEVLLHKEHGDGVYGVPWECYEAVGVTGWDWNEQDDEAASQYWFEVLDKMIYAFDSKSEPSIGDYDFHIDMEPTEDYSEDCRKYNLEVTDQEEWERYKEDMKKYDQRVQEGLDLFAKYFKNLWF